VPSGEGSVLPFLVTFVATFFTLLSSSAEIPRSAVAADSSRFHTATFLFNGFNLWPKPAPEMAAISCETLAPTNAKTDQFSLAKAPRRPDHPASQDQHGFSM